MIELTVPENVEKVMLRERNYVVPEDVQNVFVDVCAHRLALRPQARVEGVAAKQVLEEIMTKVMCDVPSDPTIVKVTITAATVQDGAPAELTYDPERCRRPRLGKAALKAERGGVPGTNAG